MTAPRGRQIIHISPDGCGGEGIARLFAHNGLRVPPLWPLTIGREVVHRRAAGLPAPEEWRGFDLMTELHHHDGYARPVARGYAAFDWLSEQFPDALFLLTTRDPEGWLADRLASTRLRRDAQASAWHLGVSTADLPEIWLAEWADHQAAVRAHFAPHPDRLLELDLDGMDFATLRDCLCPHQPALRRAALKGMVLDVGAEMKLGRVDRLLSDQTPPALHQSGPVDSDLIDRLAAFCRAAEAPPAPPAPFDRSLLSKLYGWWDGAGLVLDRDGISLRAGREGGAPPQFRLPWQGAKTVRLEGALTRLAELGRTRPIQIDMQDARRFGATPATTPAQPVLAYNRRAGAAQVALWPLSGFHEIGNPEFIMPGCPDTIPFGDKRDVVIWRGRLAGAAMLPNGQLTAVDNILSTLGKPRTSPEDRRRLIDALYRVPRMAVVRRYAGRPDIDMGLRVSWGLRKRPELPELRDFMQPTLSHAEMLTCRYQLCLAGHDVGTSFVWQANSQAVVMKEEAGWEVYYSALFQPWEHYIPLAPLAADLDEKLEWARANPARCREISAAARATVQRLAHYPSQLALMRAVMETIPATDFPVDR